MTDSDSRERELEESRMPFLEHLRDLRTHLRNAIIYLLLAFAVAYFFKDVLLAFLARPMVEAWYRLSEVTFIAKWHGQAEPEILKALAGALGYLPLGHPTLSFNSLIEPFWGYVTIALWGAVFLSSPFTFYELWKFIAPGLYKNERRWGVSFAISAAILFAAGAALCYFVVLPITFEFLLSFAKDDIGNVSGPFGLGIDLGVDIALRPQPFMQKYIGLTRQLMLGFGIAFQLPLVMFFLAILGAVTHRGLIKFNRWMVVVAFVAAAIMTPPEVSSQLLLAAPLIILYQLSIVVAFVITKRRESKQAAIDRGENQTPVP